MLYHARSLSAPGFHSGYHLVVDNERSRTAEILGAALLSVAIDEWLKATARL